MEAPIPSRCMGVIIILKKEKFRLDVDSSKECYNLMPELFKQYSEDSVLKIINIQLWY
jgi:hypothetical protein